MDDDLAYDGSNNPPKRDLTARERDILCRMIADTLGLFRYNKEDKLGISMSLVELPILVKIQKAIDPRND